MKQYKILVVEDELPLRTGLFDLFTSEGYAVVLAESGSAGLKAYGRERPDIIVLDIMMPEQSGYDVLSEIRRSDPVIPVLLLTARSEESDKVIGLELGADDYITKPFGIRELLSRVKAALRRAYESSGKSRRAKIRFGNVVIDPVTFTGEKSGRTFGLNQKEMRLISYFFEHENEVIDRFTLLDAVWGIRYEGTTRTLDQHIALLRKKIEDDPARPKFLVTVHTVGYKFVGE
jgi:DNA-binding response OmpR family regulator